MVSLSIHGCNPSPIITHPTFPTRLSATHLSPKPFPLFLSPKPSPLSLTPLKRQRTLPPPATAAAAEALETSDDAVQQIEEKEEPRVAAKGVEKPRLVLKFVWMEKNIGLGLDREIPGHGTVPLSPYYWWPRKDAWEELKSKLEEKPWVSQKRMIILLNQATDIINLWQQSSAASL